MSAVVIRKIFGVSVPCHHHHHCHHHISWTRPQPQPLHLPTPPPRPQRQWHQRQHFPGVTLLILPLPMGHLRSHMSVGSSRGTSSRTRRGRAREPGRKKKLLTRTRRITYYGDADRVDMQLLDDVLREAHAAAAGAVGEWSDRDLSAKSPQHLMRGGSIDIIDA